MHPRRLVRHGSGGVGARAEPRSEHAGDAERGCLPVPEGRLDLIARRDERPPPESRASASASAMRGARASRCRSSRNTGRPSSTLGSATCAVRTSTRPASSVASPTRYAMTGTARARAASSDAVPDAQRAASKARRTLVAPTWASTSKVATRRDSQVRCTHARVNRSRLAAMRTRPSTLARSVRTISYASSIGRRRLFTSWGLLPGRMATAEAKGVMPRARRAVSRSSGVVSRAG